MYFVFYISISGTVAYTADLTRYVIRQTALKPAAQAQQAAKDTDIFTGKPFDLDGYAQSITMDDVRAYIATLSPQEQAGFAAITAEAAFSAITANTVAAGYLDNVIRVLDISNRYRICGVTF